jgi:hypothetical protein
MVREIQYTSIQRVLDNLKDDENMQNLTLEQVVRHTIRFMEKFGYPKLYQDRQAEVEIHDFRAMLPCDLISIKQVKDCKTGVCLHSMTDSFQPSIEIHTPDFSNLHHLELTFKTQGRVIYTSFAEGVIEIAYKAVPVDDDGFPMLIDNEVYLDALEAYITLKVYTAKFRSGKLASGILQEVQQSYALAAKLMDTEFTTPSYSEAESMSRYFTSLIPRVKEFDNGFKNLGNRQYIRKH